MPQYDVYLVHDGEHGGKQHITSPVTGRRLDFYESGVWLTRPEGRNFFPYDQIRTIREHADESREGRRGESRSEEESGQNEPARERDDEEEPKE